MLEFQSFKANNQFYLAAKYGGFTPPSFFSTSTATKKQFDDNQAWWATTTDKTPDGSLRPDNYFTAARADQMVAGLTKAFSSIVAGASIAPGKVVAYQPITQRLAA